MKKLLFFAFLFICVTSVAQNKIEVDDLSIDFSIRSITGDNIELNNLYKNNSVVLVFLRGWPGYQCPICTRQVGALVEDAAKFEESGVKVILVYPGPSEKLQEHANEFSDEFKFPSNFYFTLDPEYEVVNKYGIRWDAPGETAYPATFIIDRNGKIVFSEISSSHGGRAENEDLFKVLTQIK